MTTSPTIKDIKKMLSECYKTPKHVLLHGKDSMNCIVMVLDIHASNDGNTDVVQFIANEKYPEEKMFKRRVGRVLVKANERYGMSEIELSDCPEAKEEAKKYRRIRAKVYKEVRGHYKSTESNWKRLDCKGESILSVYNRLVDGEHWQDIEIPPLDDGDRDNLYSLARVEISGSYLSDFKGTLFVDNLQCDIAKDIEYCFKLAEAIKKSSPRWLVISTRNPEVFQYCCRDQFELVPPVNEATCSQLQANAVKQESIEEATDRGANQQGGTVKFPTPPNSVWTDVEMGIDYYNKIVITTVKGKHKKHTFSQVGISKRNSKGSDPTNLEAMLCKFADAENNVIYTGKISKVVYRKMISEQKRLNSILRKYFETIEGPPITRIKGEGFKVQFSKLYLLDTIREDNFREVTTSELSDIPDSKSIN
jgi:hypothetical protein